MILGMPPLPAIFLISIFSVLVIPSASALESNGVIMTPFTESPPVIDGRWTTPDEWEDASETSAINGPDQIYMRVKHDRDFVYVMVDVVTEPLVTTFAKYGVQLLFDTNNDAGPTRGPDDLRFPIFVHYQDGREGGGSVTFSDAASLNTIDVGDSSGGYRDVTPPSNYQKRLTFSSANDPYEPGRDHLIAEYKIPLSFLHKNDRYGFGLYYWYGNTYESNAAINQKTVMWPSGLDRNSPNTYGTLQAMQNTITTPPVPFISVSTKSLSFGSVAISEKTTKSVTVQNTGTSLLKINSIYGTGEFSASGLITPTTIQPGESATFEAVFAPLTLGEKSGWITVSSNDLSNPSYAISVSGKAVEKGASPIPTGKGCLIATAAFGSELSPQVQLLREVRDNVLLSTRSGTGFMGAFNAVYYSFSPTVADWERDSPVFKEAVKTAITPMLSTLSILNYVDIGSEQEMLGYGIGIILLNLGMYFVVPAIVILKIRSRWIRSTS